MGLRERHTRRASEPFGREGVQLAVVAQASGSGQGAFVNPERDERVRAPDELNVAELRLDSPLAPRDPMGVCGPEAVVRLDGLERAQRLAGESRVLGPSVQRGRLQLVVQQAELTARLPGAADPPVAPLAESEPAQTPADVVQLGPGARASDRPVASSSRSSHPTSSSRLEVKRWSEPCH